MFCFFWCLVDTGVVGESDRLRFVVPAGVAESVDELEVLLVREVFAVEGFWAEVARKVSLESLGAFLGFLVALDAVADFMTVGVGCGCLETSSSSDSLVDELVSEDEEDVAPTAFEVAVVFGTSFADSLSEEEVSEDELCLEAVVGISTCLLFTSFVLTFFEGE